MHKVMLFGSHTLMGIPDVITNHIKAINEQLNGEVEFIVGDGNTLDAAFHKELSSLGLASKTTIYAIETPRSNVFELKSINFHLGYDEVKKEVIVTRDGAEVDYISGVLNPLDVFKRPELYAIRDRVMAQECSFAVCFWDGQDKHTMRAVDRLKAMGKFVYIYSIQV